MANEKTPVVWDDATKKHRPLGTGEKMGGLDASSIISSDSGNLITTGSDGLALVTGSSLADPRADNLLETSGNGKLQVTVDRIAEWLDGHPQDAALIADAINVVSGDSGNVITAGSDKGAFLSKGAIASAVAGMTDAQKNQLADAIAARIASDIADGQTIVASNGKLTADPTSATAAQKKAINQALADADSGLVVDNSTGKLKVDFSNMPTDKFEELLKGLKMQVPLDQNLTHIVATADANAGDTIIDGRGTEAKPWKTIQACVSYVTGLYSLNSHRITIRVKSGTYTQTVSLPRFDATSGGITIETYSGSRDVVVNAPVGSDGLTANCISGSGSGSWALRNLTVRLIAVPGDVPESGLTRVMIAANNDCRINLYGIKFELSKQAGSFSHSYAVRVVSADSGQIAFYPSSVPFGFDTVASPADNMTCNVLAAQRSGIITLSRSSDSGHEFNVPCSGSFTCFARCFDRGSIQPFTVGQRLTFTGTASGKKFEAMSGASINTGTNGDVDYFPGDVAGTVDSNTCCWYN